MPSPIFEPPKGFAPGAPLHAIPTNWAALRGIDTAAGAEREARWAYVTRVYREPMIRYVERILRTRLGARFRAEDAEDCVGQFLAGCLAKPTLSVADPGVAPFRAFLQDRLRKAALRYARDAGAKKRRPADGRALASIDAAAESGFEPIAREEADTFDREWVEALYARALERVRAAPRRARYATIVDALRRGLDLPDVTPNDRSRARKAFADAFRATVRETLPNDVFEHEEWQALWVHLPRAGDGDGARAARSGQSRT